MTTLPALCFYSSEFYLDTGPHGNQIAYSFNVILNIENERSDWSRDTGSVGMGTQKLSHNFFWNVIGILPYLFAADFAER